ncbi:MAG TPA: hypothetical protein VMB25_01350 [Bryobacteraceae bacterium]|nr:hypothetical protein [Bryobacteraceae bacterium]
MKLCVPALALLAALGALAADRHKLDVDPESQDGILLQRIEQEPTVPRKLALLEKYVAQYPKATSIAWVYEQLLPIYLDAKQYDKVLATADALLAVDPNDDDSAYDALQAAEALNNPDLSAKYAMLAWDLAAGTLQHPQPAGPDDAAEWAKQMEFAKRVQGYSEFSLATLATKETDDQKRDQLVQAIQQRNPQSTFLALAKKPSVIDLASLNPEKALQLAEEGLEKDPDNVDFLMTIADHYMSLDRDLPRVLSYSLRILDLMQTKSKPQEMSEEDWARKKAKFTGWADWMAGVVYGKQARYALSDRYLRDALEYVSQNPRLLAAAYFYLGYDNYALAAELGDKARALEAAKFSKLCAAMDSPFHSLAMKNLEALRNEYNVE